jgi:hypothetical protein
MELFKSIFDIEVINGETHYTMSTGHFFICLGLALALGLVMALCYMFKNDYSKSFVITIATLPPIVAVLIMLVSGNLAAAVSVGGVFALTRFRSNQGTSREITHIFLSMAVGLTLGLGYVWIALVLVVVIEALSITFNVTQFGKSDSKKRTLKIVIPESLDYNGLFDDLFEKYTTRNELQIVKLKNLGTMFHLTYAITLKANINEKEFIDEIRIRNANLDVVCSKIVSTSEDL